MDWGIKNYNINDDDVISQTLVQEGKFYSSAV